jgi:hypothetical protein
MTPAVAGPESREGDLLAADAGHALGWTYQRTHNAILSGKLRGYRDQVTRRWKVERASLDEALGRLPPCGLPAPYSKIDDAPQDGVSAQTPG